MEPEVRNKLDLAIEIRDVYAREILDFAGNPAIEVEVLAGGEIIGKASVAGKNYNKKEQTEKQRMDIEGKIELQKKFRFTGILEVYVQYIQVCRSWSEKKKLR